MAAEARNVIGCDQHGALYAGRAEHMNASKSVARTHQPQGEQGTIHDVIKVRMFYLGLSVPGVINVEDCSTWPRNRSSWR